MKTVYCIIITKLSCSIQTRSNNFATLSFKMTNVKKLIKNTQIFIFYVKNNEQVCLELIFNITTRK